MEEDYLLVVICEDSVNDVGDTVMRCYGELRIYRAYAETTTGGNLHSVYLIEIFCLVNILTESFVLISKKKKKLSRSGV